MEKESVNPVALVVLTLALPALSIPGQVGGSLQGEFTQANPSGDGCSSCHSSLSQILPGDHLQDMLEDLELCLNCHSEGGDAVSLGFLSHSRHYALKEFAEGGKCWSCHRMDEASRFDLLGTDGDIDTTIELSRDEVERLGSYFVSWASSEYLDHRHGRAGNRCLHCHGNDLPVQPVAMDVCMGCHGSYVDLAELTAQR